MARLLRWAGTPQLLVYVLVLVLIAFSLLVAALLTSTTDWAWGSVAASLLAGALLTVDWASRRGHQHTAGPATGITTAPATTGTAETAEAEQPTRPEPATSRTEPEAAGPAGPLDPKVEPDEEDTDAVDIIEVSDLTDEVRVIDERPRYHLADCVWLAGRDTIPLPVNEARELGFTPCAVCTPDAKLAARHRLARR